MQQPTITPTEPATVRSHALDHLRYIRETMQRAGSFTSVSGAGAVAAGATALVAAAIASRQKSVETWLVVWTIDAAFAATVGAVLMVRKARAGNTPLFSPLGRRFLLGFSTPVLAAAVLTVVLYVGRLPRAIPGMWLLLYGTAFVTAGAFSVRVVPLMGLCFIVLGIATFFLDLQAGNIMLAAGFGLLHLIFGVIIIRRYGG